MLDSKTKAQIVQAQSHDLLSILNREQPKYLVEGLLVEGGLSLLTGRHRSYKSFFALEIALSVATGQSAFGYTTKHGKVAYVAAEGILGITRRANAWLSHYNVELQEGLRVHEAPIQLTDRDTLEAYIEHIGQRDLIVIDTLARCAAGLDENNATDMGRFVEAITTLSQQTKAHVLVVHHNNKSDTYRGSTALPAAVDTHISIKRERNAITVTTEKQKDDDEPAPFKLKGVKVNDSIVLKHDSQLSTNELALVKTLTEPLTNAEWKAKAMLNDSAFSNALKLLKSKHVLKINPAPAGKIGQTYELLSTFSSP